MRKNFIEYYIQGLVEQNQKNITEVKKTASILLNGNCLKKHDWLKSKIKLKDMDLKCRLKEY